jgi:hypothetical protein
MRLRLRLLSAMASAILGATLWVGPALAATTPVDNGCPASADLVSVAAFPNPPYRLPSRIDDPANGGNGDGYICAFPLPDAMAEAMGETTTIYQFFEDNLPAEGRP